MRMQADEWYSLTSLVLSGLRGVSAHSFIESVVTVAPFLSHLTLDVQPPISRLGPLQQMSYMFGVAVPESPLRSASNAILPHCSVLRVLHLKDEMASSDALENLTLLEELILSLYTDCESVTSPLHLFLRGDCGSLPRLKSLGVSQEMPIMFSDVHCEVVQPACTLRGVALKYHPFGWAYDSMASSISKHHFPSAASLLG